MVFLLIITVGILSIIFPKSKFVSVLGFVLIFLLWGWNYWNGDFDSYEEIFYNIGKYGLDSSSAEYGYRFLNFGISELGFDFQGFMVINSLITLTFIWLFIRESHYPAIFTLFYFIIFVMSFVFIRNYLADALFLHFVLLTFSRKNVKQKLLFSFLIFLIAILFHNTAILFCVFLLVLFEKISNKKLIFIVSGIILLFFTSINIFLSFINDATILSKIQYYQSDINPFGPALSHLLVVIAPSLFIWLNKEHTNYIIKEDYLKLSMLQRINIVSLIYIPLYFVFPDFSRFFKVLFTINIFFLLELFYIYKPLNSRIILSILFISIYLILLYQFSFSTLDFTLYPLFESNLIFNEKI
ncbi:EpsG family protein [Sphingobacterium mizutaii]|uniref:EpsG family protein n=1 Tax=Sphingobacterium mizutaii TaxID=1010 RepID=UPI0016237CFF|nr:EpsG family protein [Sphingobacterium mizutaii]